MDYTYKSKGDTKTKEDDGMNRKNKMSKDTVPEGFTVAMALMDLLPVLFFGGTGFMLGILLSNPLTQICAVVVFLSGLLKVIWKFIAAVCGKNIWPLFVQMRVFMPIGFIVLVMSVIISLTVAEPSLNAAVFIGMPQFCLFLTGLIGLAAMIICAVKFDSSDPKSNWIEQGINSAAQACFFFGLLIITAG